MPQIQLPDSDSQTPWLIFVYRQRIATVYSTETAISRACTTKDHKCGRPFFKTFCDVRAQSFLADGV
jgi:hypothetical protein